MPRRTAPVTWALLAFLTVAALGLRLAGLPRLLPVHAEPDASLVHMYRELAGDHTPEAALHFGVYPTLVPRAMALVLGGAGLAPAPLDASLDEHLAAASAPYVHVRAVIALLATLLVPLTFFLARRWLADRWALVAAAFVAVSLLHVAHSTVAKAHGAHASMAWLAILCALRQVERTTLRRCAATAAAAALAIGTFHTGFVALLPLGAAALLAWPLGATGKRNGRIAAWAVAPLALAGGLLFTPGGLGFGPNGVRFGFGHRIAFSGLNGGGLLLWPSYVWEHDPALALLAVLGLVVLALGVRRCLRAPALRRDGFVIATYALPYALLISLDRMVQERYVLPLLPLIAVAAAVGLRALVGRARGPLAVAAAAAVALAFPTWVALLLARLEQRPSTLEQTASWLEAARARGERLALRLSPNLSPPLFPDDAALAAQLATTAGRGQPWFAYLGRLPAVPSTAPRFDLRPFAPELFAQAGADPEEFAAFLDREAPDLVLIEVSLRMTYAHGFATLRELLRERGELVVRFSGESGRHSEEAALDYQGVRDPARRLLSAACLGPDIEVYRWLAPRGSSLGTVR